MGLVPYTFYVYLYCTPSERAGTERVIAIQQSPTWVTIPQLTLIVPTDVPFQISVSNIEKGCSFYKVTPIILFFLFYYVKMTFIFQVNILNALSLIIVFYLRSGYSETFIWIQ